MWVELIVDEPILVRNGFIKGEIYWVSHQDKVLVNKNEGRWKRCYLIEQNGKTRKGNLKWITIYTQELKVIHNYNDKDI